MSRHSRRGLMRWQEGALSNHLSVNYTHVGWWPTMCQQLLELWPWTRQTSVLLLQKFNPEKSHHLNQKWERLGGEGQREIMDRRREKRVIFPEGKRHIYYYIWSLKSCPIMWPQYPLNITPQFRGSGNVTGSGCGPLALGEWWDVK